MNCAIVVAADEAGGIGRNGDLPWRIKEDMKFFSELTKARAPSEAPNIVIMGRKTWESLPPKWQPLPRRTNFVVTRQANYDAGDAHVFPSLDAALAAATGRTFVVGGGEIYRLALRDPRCGQAYVTRVAGTHECDTFFPDLGDDFVLSTQSREHAEGSHTFRYQYYQRKQTPCP